EGQRIVPSNQGEAARQLQRDWSIRSNRPVLPSQMVDLSYSRQLDPGIPMGLIAGFGYRYRQAIQPEKETRVIQSYHASSGGSLLNGDYLEVEGTENACLSGIVNLFLRPSATTKIGFRNL